MNGLVHNGINIDNCFVSTDFHSILLLGGWWYTTDEDAAMIGTSKDIYNIMPPLVKANKISKSITDIESIKAFGRQYISTSAPQTFKNFLSSGTKENSIEESKKWDKALIDSYGKRKFIKIITNKNLVYKKGSN